MAVESTSAEAMHPNMIMMNSEKAVNLKDNHLMGVLTKHLA